MLKPKVGDMVRLKTMRVLSIDHTDSTVMLRDDKISTWTYVNDIEEILPHPLAVGDRVFHVVAGFEGELIGINGDDAWVRTNPVNTAAVKVKNLQLAVKKSGSEP